eukprot:CAMPEP_0181213296 /NCGR_PEP_ID=MMETSP1096-20121128/24824_1 /TAXON_ID=156174 ORGANISM="Chrysochromulina ericina, Strain CCMP281" /NCGR_SAMPLE_ID=MMETSP1096 /ASSEMBLY_ACC=CAM_ASM_000453 /LENGTH=40 /DNA_ID= /DNA_START= /DNA_END= /DNA_ORIENTATION=
MLSVADDVPTSKTLNQVKPTRLTPVHEDMNALSIEQQAEQ